MTFTDTAFHTIKEKAKFLEDELVYKPKIIRTYQENGHTVTVYEPGYAESCCCGQYVKPVNWRNENEISF